MAKSSQHAEWLNLVEHSGPFVSAPVLADVFPQGLDAHDPELLKNLKAAYTEWEEEKDKPAIHRAWVEFVLRTALGFENGLLLEGQAIPPGLEARFPEHGVTLRPDYVLVNPQSAPHAGRARLLVRLLPPDQDLEKPEPGSRWKASPDTRMMELCHAAGVPLGLITNGERWMLVYAPVGETTGFASWYAHLWFEEHLTLRAWYSLLGKRRFFGVSDDQILEALLRQSAERQQDVTDQLGLQVRQAVELFVQTVDRIDLESGRTVLKSIDPEELYEAALTVMMRLVFLFCAEERGLLLLGEPVYDQFYAVSTLSALLREAADQHGEEILERRSDAWSRLLATFRAVYGGVQHENVRLQPYGGSLFDPDRFPFLEGRARGTSWREVAGKPLRVENRTVLHLMEALQFLQSDGERQRLSFRALDIEQIGHVYEGLLDHTVFRVPDDEVVLSLSGTKDREPEVPLSTLETLLAKGEKEFIEYLREETGRSPKALQNALKKEIDLYAEPRLRAACANDEAVIERVRPFAALVRNDSMGHPVVILGGSYYVTQGSERRKTGTHYTPRSLTEPIVQYTLEPLVYEGPAEGRPRDQWKLKSAKELLELKICDMAMGSGAFLVQTVRYLAERLVEAWETAAETPADAEDPEPRAAAETAMASVLARPSSRKAREIIENAAQTPDNPPEIRPIPAPRITTEGLPATGDLMEQIIPDDLNERLIYARRIVCDRCIYGVDINSLAVEMSKLSLWLITMDKGRAFNFLDHALKCGDSLLGLWDVEQVHKFHLDPEAHVQGGLWGVHVQGIFGHAMARRRELESFPVIDVHSMREKARLLREADDAMEVVRILCDQLIAVGIDCADGEAKKRGAMVPKTFEQRRTRIFDKLVEANSTQEVESAVEAVRSLAPEGAAMLNSGNPNPPNARRPFHWPLEFPEILAVDEPEQRGFSAFVGNPPFQGGQKITGFLGTDFRNYCIDAIANGQKGSADLCAYFFLRAGQLLRPNGGVGLLATNTIAQGDTREVGLDQLVKKGFSIPRAVASRKWPGAANLEVAHVWLRKGGWKGAHVLEDKPVKGITPYLSIPGKITGEPYRLAANEGKSFQGSIVLGLGFVMTPEEAQALIDRNPENKNVLYPYLNGEDLNSRPDQSPSRWVINFHNWPLDRSASGSWDDADEKDRRKYLQNGRVPSDYPAPVAADYPDCLAIVEEKVKPERQRKKQNGQYALRKPLPQRWWHYAEKRPALYAAIAGMERVLVIPETTKYCAFSVCSTGQVFSHMTKVISEDDLAIFSTLSSSLHDCWARTHSSTLESRLKYITTDAYETWPAPLDSPILCNLGETYHKTRRELFHTRGEGLTKTYNRFHDPDEDAQDIMRLRALHAEMDRAVADAYGWTDLDLGHDFHETKQGIRFTVCEAARREILDRLLALNHERYAEEVAQGLHDKGKKKSKKPKSKRTSKNRDDQGDLI